MDTVNVRLLASILVLCSLLGTFDAQADVVGTFDNDCIRMQMAVRLNVTYVDSNGDTTVGEVRIPTDKNFQVAGECALEESKQSINVTFYEDWSLEFIFTKDAENVTVSDVTIAFTTERLADGTNQSVSQSLLDLTLFQAPLGKSYKCNRDELEFTSAGVIAYFTDIQVEAFRDSSSADFSTAFECDSIEAAGSSSDLVPIIAGVVLATVVIVVLVVFVIQRSRRQSI